MMSHSMASLGLAVALLGAAPAGASTVYVAQEGVDAPVCGTRAAPCRTISSGLDVAEAGDTILVGPGLYGELNGDGVFDDPGEEAAELGSGCDCMLHVTKRVTIVSEAGAAATVIQGGSIAPTIVDIGTGGVVFGRRGQGFTVTGAGPNQAQGAVETQPATADVILAGNVIAANSGFGIWILGIAHQLLDNRVADNSTAGVLIEAQDTALERNTASRNPVGFEVKAAGITFEDDVAVGNTAVGFSVLVLGTGTRCTRCSALGNRFAGISTQVSLTLLGGRVVGNGVGDMNCGVSVLEAVSLDAKGVYWGSAAGPGDDPADIICALTGSTIVTDPIAAKPKRLRLKPLR